MVVVKREGGGGGDDKWQRYRPVMSSAVGTEIDFRNT